MENEKKEEKKPILSLRERLMAAKIKREAKQKPGLMVFFKPNLSPEYPSQEEYKIFQNFQRKKEMLDEELDYSDDEMAHDEQVSDSLPDEDFWPESKESHEKKEVYDENVYRGLSDKEFGPKLRAFLKFNNGIIALEKEIINFGKLSLLNAENYSSNRENLYSSFNKYYHSIQRISTLHRQLMSLYPKSEEKHNMLKHLFMTAIRILDSDAQTQWCKFSQSKLNEAYKRLFINDLRQASETLREYDLIMGLASANTGLSK